jgi:ATP-dependent Clp protease, protease subunit
MSCPEEKDESRQQPEGIASRILKTRTIVLTGEVDQEMAERVIGQLLVLDADSHDPIRMVINSPGGHVDSGYAIHDMMRFVASEVIAVGAGWVASIAVPILFGAAKGNRLALPNTRFLLHQPSGGAGGQLQDIRIEAVEMLKIRERLNELIATETGQTLEKIQHDSDRNFWMNASEAKAYGIVDRIVTSVKDI